ncbi:filamentous hemagglutinin N-terminal domain-containing protein [Pseudanabaena sp. UWO311]|uniref:two-partner secretion domain-containing protein n=2 Tax=Pseudanabaena sp. UWO311 TaxID=2487337 RepID=UPI00167FE447|nr:filamentous hemagglutinin N-terminal domain-containing protein [Pseudanabaena sp. UWO311]
MLRNKGFINMMILRQNFLENIAILRFALANFSVICIPELAFAQITPDTTLPTNSIVGGGPTFTITGGTTANTNLFHSFSQFSLINGERADFANSPAIQNILVRVTGGNISSIDGVISAIGNANLFLINPSGIVFGQNARLLIGGSFLATTANSVRFLDGSEFRANANTQTTSPLLLVSTPVGLQFNGTTNGAIVAQGNGNGLEFIPFEIFSPNNPSLNVGGGVIGSRTLALVGGDVTLQGANLTADSGRIELGSVAGNGFVAIAQTANNLILNYDQVPNLGNIRLEQAASADTSGDNGGGSIQVQGKQVSLSDGSVLRSSSLLNGNGGEIFVRATEFLSARGESNTPFPSGIFTDTSSVSSGKGSNITIATNRLELTEGAQISASTYGSGNAGEITVNASEILLKGRSNSDFYGSGIFSQVLDIPVTGNSGKITVTTDNLQILNGASLTTSTFGSGSAGDLTVTAKNIILFGTNDSPTSITSAADFGSTGNGGLLTIKSDNLSINNGAQISVSTRSSGNAGNLVVTAKSVDIAGQVENGRSGLFANAIFDTGNGGDIVVNSDRVTVRDGGIISASNFRSNSTTFPGSGSVGNITINSPSILLNGGRINIDSLSGSRGNINLNSTLTVLRNASSISTNALGNATGGNIRINTDFLVAVPLENSDITANSLNSFGGQVIITAKGVIGFQLLNRLTPFSDITATSALGTQFNGLVEIRSPDNDLSRGLVKLPDNLTDTNKQIVAACDRFRGNELISTGRGGAPTDATQTISSQAVWKDLRLSEVPSTQSNPTSQTETNLVTTQSTRPVAIQPIPQIEAQGWEKDGNGNLKLLASATSPSAPVWRLPVICPVSNVIN